MENRQNSSQSNQSFSNQSSQSNQPNASQSSQSSSRIQSNQPTASSSTGSSIGNQQSARTSTNSQTGSSSSKIGGLDMNTVTSKLQEFGTTAMNKVNSLSTTQKVVGGSLLALGAGWLAMNRNKTPKNRTNYNTTKTNKFGRSSS
ncbi:hypothetical protein [Pontibacter fetidus]|uniref:Uncharacterized protein n=1 Tax=Pontibacter fetidus TaxID=2700082 RepID=A0A6B2HAM1_9BACT|nr:hypothetical protein [Pontibacter fetidus]NDK56782.1 hypothetical protein [Pontibacter fetidus]